MRGAIWLVPAAIILSGASSASGTSASVSEATRFALSGDKGQPGLPTRSSITGSLVVRPDLLSQALFIRASDVDLDKAFQQAKGRLEEISRKASEATSGAAKVRMRNLSTSRATAEQSSGGRLQNQVELSGELEVPLLQEMDYWSRARLALALARLAEQYDSGSQSVRVPGVATTLGRPAALVSEPEKHRARLVEHWTRRAKDFAIAAQSEGAPLDVQDCDPPGEITQAQPSLEEVTLSLRITCRIDVARISGPERKGARGIGTPARRRPGG